MTNIVIGGSSPSEGFELKSVRFNDGDSAYVARTPTANGDRRTWTFSCWFKKAKITGAMRLISSANDSTFIGFKFSSTEDILRVDNNGSYNYTTAVYRDPSAWYHLVVSLDTTLAVAADRLRAWINGTQVTWANSGDVQALNGQGTFNYTSQSMSVGSRAGSEPFDGYIAECYFLDGIGVSGGSDFAETNALTNQWQPIDPTDIKEAVTFGNNGFYLPFNNDALDTSFTDTSNAKDENYTFTPTANIDVDYLVVAGGGGGGAAWHDSGNGAGGGGAGGLRTGASLSVTSGTDYTVVVGGGGAGANYVPNGSTGVKGVNGKDSIFSTITSTGGGGGGSRYGAPTYMAGSTGGSGGGGASYGTDGGLGGAGNTPSTSPAQGFAGGNTGGAPNTRGGGGGGSSAVGDTGSQTAVGGAGTANAYRTGSNVTYAGGGGGGGSSVANTTGGAGGAGGGGAGGNHNGTNGIVGTANTGSGGGGGGAKTSGSNSYNVRGFGGAGGSGIVVVRYQASSAQATGGTITTYGSGGSQYYVHSFTTPNSRNVHTITVVGNAKNERIKRQNLEVHEDSTGGAHFIGPKVGTSCIAFDGSTDYLIVPDHADWDISTGDFTFEAWVNLKSHHASEESFFYTSSGSTLGFRWDNKTLLKMNLASGELEQAYHLDTHKWYHLAFVRASAVAKFFVNGTQIGSNQASTHDIAVSSTMLIGGRTANSRYVNGYMDEIRFSNSARYTADFTPSTTAFSSDSNTKLLIHSNTTMGSTTFDDDGATDHTITANGDVKHIAPKSGKGCYRNNGSGNGLQISRLQNMYNTFESGNSFTIEAWVCLDNIGTNNQQFFTHRWTTNDGDWVIWWDSSSGLVLSGDSNTFSQGNTTGWASKTWVHFAVTRQGGTARMFIDGVLKNSVSHTVEYDDYASLEIMSYGNSSGFSSSGAATGFMDSARITNECLYVDDFTPSAALTDGTKTNLLLHCDGGVNIDPATGLGTGAGEGQYAYNAAANGIFYGADNLPLSTAKSYMTFDGTGDTIYAPSSAEWEYGTNNFTWEAFIKLGADPDAGNLEAIILHGNLGDNYDALVWYGRVYSKQGISWYQKNGSGGELWDMVEEDNNPGGGPTGSWNRDVWYHVAIVRDAVGSVSNSRNFTIWKDGIPILSETHSNALAVNHTPMNIGSYDSAGVRNWTGDMDLVRVSDNARYSKNFTPSTSAFANDSDTILLLHCDGSDGATSFTDNSTVGHTITATGGANTDTAIKKIGTASAQFDGSGAFLSVPDHADWDKITRSRDWTIEFWVYPTQNESASVALINHAAGGGHGWNINWAGSGNIRMYNANDGSGGVTSTTAISNNVWTHVAFQYNSKERFLRVYLNGNLDNADTNTVSWTAPGSYAVYIGAQDTGSLIREFTGQMDEIRISTVERYGNFVVPTAPFVADANTQLLVQSDFSEGGLGADHSGNYNYMTPTNLTADDMMLDSPMNNFCTLNPLMWNGIDRFTLSEGNLKIVPTGGNWNAITGTMALPDSGKWYWETKSDNGNVYIGIVDNAEDLTATNPTGGTVWYGDDGRKRIDGTFSSYGAGYGSANLSGIAVDMDASPRTITFYKDNTSQGVITITGSCATDTVYPYISSLTTNYINFGQDSSFAGQKTAQGNQDDNDKGDFYYAPPSGYLALCTDNLPAPSIALPEENFKTLLWDGAQSGSSAPDREFTGVGFSPDAIMSKSRVGANNSQFVYTGTTASVQQALELDAAAHPGQTHSSGYVDTIDADGWTSSAGSSGVINWDESGRKYVAWNWKAGGATTANNSASAGATPTAGSVKINGANLTSALAGSIAATRLSANTSSGFSIGAWAGTGSAGATIAHGLSQVPEMIVNKNTTASNTGGWYIYHKDMYETDPEDYWMEWNANRVHTNATWTWNDTAPTASVFSVGSDTNSNASGQTFVTMCWHSVEGYSKVGVYTGNGNTDGPFVYTGFRPTWILVKNSDLADDWEIYDASMNPYNKFTLGLKMNTVAAAYDISGNRTWDFLSNGFKVQGSNGGINTNNDEMIYLAIAESPFKTSNAR